MWLKLGLTIYEKVACRGACTEWGSTL